MRRHEITGRTGNVLGAPVTEVPMSQISDGDTFHSTFARVLDRERKRLAIEKQN
jgi:hypothetical protein